MPAKDSAPTTSGHSKSFFRAVKKQMLLIHAYVLGGLIKRNEPDHKTFVVLPGANNTSFPHLPVAKPIALCFSFPVHLLPMERL